MIFGWGENSKSWDIGDGYTLVARWSYIHVLFFPIGSRPTWYIVGDKRSEDRIISYEEVKRLVPVNTPKVGIMSRFGLFVAIGVFWALVVIFG